MEDSEYDKIQLKLLKWLRALETVSSEIDNSWKELKHLDIPITSSNIDELKHQLEEEIDLTNMIDIIYKSKLEELEERIKELEAKQ